MFVTLLGKIFATDHTTFVVRPRYSVTNRSISVSMTSGTQENWTQRAYAALAVAGCLWGTGFLFGKWALTELSVAHMVFYRFAFAAVGFAPATIRGLRRAETRIARRDLPLFLTAALLGVPVQFLIQFAGLARTTVSHASLMVGNLPVLLAAGAAIFAHERVTARRWVALVASTLGASLIAVGASQGEAGAAASTTGEVLVPPPPPAGGGAGFA